MCIIVLWTNGIGIGIIGHHGGDVIGSTPGGIGSALTSVGVQCGGIGTAFTIIGTITGIFPIGGVVPGGLPIGGLGMATTATTGLAVIGGGHGGNLKFLLSCLILRISFRFSFSVCSVYVGVFLFVWCCLKRTCEKASTQSLPFNFSVT